MPKMICGPGVIRLRRKHRQTILHSLYDREINGTKFRKSCVKTAYQTIHPNCTVMNVEKPPCYLRKFTPDGRHLIAFSHDQTSIEVYNYLGCSMAASLLKNYEGNCIGRNNEGDIVRKQIFERLFQLKHRIKVSPEGEQLNRECSLFLENGYNAVVGSAAVIPEDMGPHFFEMYTNNEALTPNSLFPLEDYTIYLIDLNIGVVCHCLNFKADRIFLSHNQGIYLYNNTLAILSVQHQIIHVYKIIHNRFCLVKRIGRFCFEDDHLLITSIYTIMNSAMYRPFRENSINGLKHKLMVFLYKKAEREAKITKSPYPLRKFYQYFDQFVSLRIWKMQLLDENHILIRYASEDVATVKIPEPNLQLSFFMVYNLATTMVLDVFENTSSQLLKIYENFCDNLRNSCLNPEGFMTCSLANNVFSWESHQKFKNTILNAKFGGTMEANKRILGQLPVAAQSFTSSPYLDTSLYSYDEKWVSPMERPKVVSEYPIKFYSRESALLSFCLYTSESKGPTMDHRRLVAFTFHPTDPFAISVQRDNFEYIVNFHIRKVYIPE